MTIMRGLPGAGKSTYIREKFQGATPAPLAPKGWSPVVVSGDHFFTDWSTGEYLCDPTRFGEAHNAATSYLIKAMSSGVAHVIVDNTHVRAWEWRVSMALAVAFGYKVEFMDLFDGGLTDDVLAARNVHRIPAETISNFRKKWEPIG